MVGGVNLMPDKHVYFSIGAAVGSGIAFLIGKNRHKLQETKQVFKSINRVNRHWFLYFPVVIGLVGLWGLVPDIIHALGILEKDITRTAWFNIFFFHSWFEQIESTNPNLDRVFDLAGQAILFFICIGIMLTYVHFIKVAVKKHEQRKK